MKPAHPGPGHPAPTHSPQVGRPARPRGGTEGRPGLVITRKGPAAAMQDWWAPQVGVSAVGPLEPGGLLGISGLHPLDASSIPPTHRSYDNPQLSRHHQTSPGEQKCPPNHSP